MGEPTLFVPGAYWTPERRQRAHDELLAVRDSDAMQAMMRAIAEASAGNGDPAAASAAFGPPAAATGGGAVRREVCVFRRGVAADLPALAALIVSGELPPFFLEPVIDGFLVIEHDEHLVGAGGLEFYKNDAVIRSVVVDPAARGQGLGLDIARLLEQDAFESGARDVYLFTLHAYQFWLKHGYKDLSLNKWPADVRENWQYQFVSGYPEASRGVHAMVKRGSP